MADAQENSGSKLIKITVKTPKEKKDLEIDPDAHVKKVNF